MKEFFAPNSLPQKIEHAQNKRNLQNLLVKNLNGHKKGAMPAERGKPFRACEVKIDMKENYGVVLPPPIYIYADIF